MGSSTSGGKSKKCQQCRIRRIKCDLKHPQCSQCVSVGLACSGPIAGNIFITMGGHNTKDEDAEPSQGHKSQRLLSNTSSGLHQPNYPLVRSVGQISYDPFSTYPKLPYASEGVDGLVSFYLGVIGPKIISLNPRRLWFSSALSDPVLFQATLYSAALYSNSVWRSGDSPLAIFHRTQLLGMVNNRLRDPTQGLSDKTVAAVALIVYTEVVNGPIADYATHMGGLKQMMKLRASVEEESDLQGLLQRMVASSTVFAAIRQNCAEPAPLPSPEGFEIEKPCSSSATDRPIHPSVAKSSSVILEKLEQHGFSLNVLLVINDLCHIVSFFKFECCQFAAENYQADLDAQLLYTEHRLVKVQTAQISAYNQVQKSFCVACLIFTSLFLREMPGPVFLNEALTKRLRETMGSIDPASWATFPPEIMLWMLFMGGIVAKERPEKPWFLLQLSMLSTSIDLRDWELVKASLKSVLWVYKIPEETCQALCYEVITLQT